MPRDGAPRSALRIFGREIGLAFQLLDDVLDVTGPPERTGKARGTDLLDGTVTLPLILARERDRLAGEARTCEGWTPRRAEAVCDRIAATGVLDEVRAGARRRVELAKRALERSAARRRSAPAARSWSPTASSSDTPDAAASWPGA